MFSHDLAHIYDTKPKLRKKKSFCKFNFKSVQWIVTASTSVIIRLTNISLWKDHHNALFIGPTIKKNLFAVSRQTQKNCPYQKTLVFLKRIFFYFMFSDSPVFENVLYYIIEELLKGEWIGINAIAFFNSYLKSLPFNSVCKTKKCLPANPRSKFWVGWQ